MNPNHKKAFQKLNEMYFEVNNQNYIPKKEAMARIRAGETLPAEKLSIETMKAIISDPLNPHNKTKVEASK